ncbi:MAG: cation transporter [Candidatus Krumholzibacteriia bacterium]
MTCQHCVAAVRQALAEVPGSRVHEVQVGNALVPYDPDQTDVDRLVAAVEDAGYDVIGREPGA